MSDEDMIRRGDAIAYVMDYLAETGSELEVWDIEQILLSIPAVQPTVKPLRYIEPEGETLEQMRDHARQHHLAQAGDMRLVWVNEGDLHMHTIFHAVQPTVSPDVIEIDINAVMMEQIEEAAAQSPWVPPEYAMNEVISDCCSFLREPRYPSPDVAALVETLDRTTSLGQRSEYSRVGHHLNEASWHVHLAGFRSRDEAEAFLTATLARVKGVM